LYLQERRIFQVFFLIKYIMKINDSLPKPLSGANFALGLVGLYKKTFFNLFLQSFWLPWKPDFYRESYSSKGLEALHPRNDPARFD
jgi:hypothetical protein